MKKNLFYVFCFFICFTTQANNKISYLYKDISFTEVLNTNETWTPYQQNMNHGLRNGVYWFKLEFLESSKEHILSIPESHITVAQLFCGSTKIKHQKDSRYITYSIPPSVNNKKYYLKVNCLLEAKIPIVLKPTEKHYKLENNNFLFIGAYYGIVLLILIFNFFSYLSFNNKTYLYYMFMVLGMAIDMFYKDGFINQFFEFGLISQFIEPYLNLILALSAIFFVKSYIDPDNEIKKGQYFGILLFFITTVSVVVYSITNSFTIFIISQALTLLTIDVYWFFGVVLWKKNIYAKFFTIAYFIPLVVAHDYYLFTYFGFNIFNTSTNLFRFGSLFEMLIFTYGIMHFSKNIALQNKKYRSKIIEFTQELNELKYKKSSKELQIEFIDFYKLTDTEIKILKSIGEHKTNKSIASQFFISENTVKFHIKNIYTKLEVKNRREAKYKYKKIS